MFAFFKYDLIQPLIPPPSKLQPTCWAFALVKLPGMILPQCLYYWPFLSLTSQLKCHLGRAISANHLPWKGTCYFFYHPFIPHTMNQNDELFCSGLFLVVATCCEYLLITFPTRSSASWGQGPCMSCSLLYLQILPKNPGNKGSQNTCSKNQWMRLSTHCNHGPDPGMENKGFSSRTSNLSRAPSQKPPDPCAKASLAPCIRTITALTGRNLENPC